MTDSMPDFDPRKFHGRRLNEVAKGVDDDIRRVLHDAWTTYQFCLRQKHLAVRSKGYVRMRLWQVEKQLGLHPHYFSQAGQDRYVHEEIFGSKRSGTFVEIGGGDGWTGSNCVFFEKVLGWSGLVVEALPQLVTRISETRSATVVHAAVSDRDGTAEFLEVTSGMNRMGGLVDHIPSEVLEGMRRDEKYSENVVTVPTTRLDTLLRAHGLDKIDYCSIDVEGAEHAVLRGVDFAEFDIAGLSIGNNRRERESKSYQDIMGPAGYRRVALLGMDEIWVKQSE